MSNWRRRAREAIGRAIADMHAAGMDLRGPDLARHVDPYYPFGERANHPYRVWLDERRALLDPPKPRPARPRRPDASGQGHLFGDR